MKLPQGAQAVGQLLRRGQQPRHGHILDNVLQGRLKRVQATQHKAMDVGTRVLRDSRTSDTDGQGCQVH